MESEYENTAAGASIDSVHHWINPPQDPVRPARYLNGVNLDEHEEGPVWHWLIQRQTPTTNLDMKPNIRELKLGKGWSAQTASMTESAALFLWDFILLSSFVQVFFFLENRDVSTWLLLWIQSTSSLQTLVISFLTSDSVHWHEQSTKSVPCPLSKADGYIRFFFLCGAMTPALMSVGPGFWFTLATSDQCVIVIVFLPVLPLLSPTQLLRTHPVCWEGPDHFQSSTVHTSIDLHRTSPYPLCLVLVHGFNWSHSLHLPPLWRKHFLHMYMVYCVSSSVICTKNSWKFSNTCSRPLHSWHRVHSEDLFELISISFLKSLYWYIVCLFNCCSVFYTGDLQCWLSWRIRSWWSCVVSNCIKCNLELCSCGMHILKSCWWLWRIFSAFSQLWSMIVQSLSCFKIHLMNWRLENRAVNTQQLLRKNLTIEKVIESNHRYNRIEEKKLLTWRRSSPSWKKTGKTKTGE